LINSLYGKNLCTFAVPLTLPRPPRQASFPTPWCGILDIIEGAIAPGEKLPANRVMTARIGMTRYVAHQAIDLQDGKMTVLLATRHIDSGKQTLLHTLAGISNVHSPSSGHSETK